MLKSRAIIFYDIISILGNKIKWFDAYFQRDVEAEMRRLKIELKQTMDMYSSACKEALDAKQKV